MLANLTVDSRSSAIGKQGDLPGALAHRRGPTVECFDKDDGLVRGHGKIVGECLVIEWFAPCSKMIDPLFVK
jgi:hypothetical protein